MTPLLILVGAYLAGSLPFGLIVARAAKGIDIREHGSKNIGATNVTRVLGWKWGAACFVLDVLKGALPIAFPKMLFALGDPNRVHWLVAAGLLAILGHMFPIWLGFHGGKGVATALGVVVMLANPISTAITFGAFVACFVATRIVSISSITAAVTFVVAQLYFLWPQPFQAKTWSVAAFSIAVPTLIIVKHRSNIGRLLRGEEPRFGSKPPQEPDQDQLPPRSGD
ncbi:MAG: glycerol-3-phosphate 1-O-acyltransferase [Planctomycetota bacterium]|nr:MAG: glycerol-3-phosphate 1-O-acyltransferase [Planctomycetota bacterium]GDY07865.1 glycerol-3-phosphate acyltransferase [Planctomycetia bacterium]